MTFALYLSFAVLSSSLAFCGFLRDEQKCGVVVITETVVFGYNQTSETLYPPSSSQTLQDYLLSTTDILEANANGHISTAPYGTYSSTEFLVEMTEAVASTRAVNSDFLEAPSSVYTSPDQIYSRPAISLSLLKKYHVSSLNLSSSCEPQNTSSSYSFNATTVATYTQTAVTSTVDTLQSSIIVSSTSSSSATPIFPSLRPNITDGISFETIVPTNCKNLASATATLEPHTFVLQDTSFPNIMTAYSHPDGSLAPLLGVEAEGNDFIWDLSDPSRVVIITSFALIVINERGLEITKGDCSETLLILVPDFLSLLQNQGNPSLARRDHVALARRADALFTVLLTLKDDCGTTLTTDLSPEVFAGETACGVSFVPELDLYSANCTYSDSDTCQSGLQGLVSAVLTGTVASVLFFIPGALQLVLALLRILPAVSSFLGSNSITVPLTIIGALGLLANAWSADAAVFICDLLGFPSFSPLDVSFTVLGESYLIRTLIAPPQPPTITHEQSLRAEPPGVLGNLITNGDFDASNCDSSDPLLPWSSRSLGEFPGLGVVGSIAESRGDCHSGSSCALVNATGYASVLCPDDPTGTSGQCPHAAWLTTTIDPPLVAGNPYVFEMWTNVQSQAGPTVTSDGKPAPFEFSTCGIGAYTAGAKLAARRLNMDITDVGKWVLTSAPFVATEEMGLATLTVGMRCIFRFGFEVKLDSVVIRADEEA